MSIPTVDFPRFSQLPAELRDQVWEYCLPYRVCELDQPVDNVVFWRRDNGDGPWECTLRHTTSMNASPPLISRVCRESRSVAFHSGSFMSDDFYSRPTEARVFYFNTPWQDRVRDSVHLNWTTAMEAEYAHNDDVSPLHFLAWEASRTSCGGSLTFSYLTGHVGHRSELVNMRYVRGPPIPKISRDLNALKQSSTWLVVMRTVVVHADLVEAGGSGLFGLLGDAPIQIVAVSEENTVEAYFRFAETCEHKATVTVKQDFSRDSAASKKQILENAVLKHYQSKELVEALQPAIMFRLCTRMCNHFGLALPWPPSRARSRPQRGRGRGRSDYKYLT